MDEKLTILYEDSELIVCHKPAGVSVQSAKIGQKDMVSILNTYLAQAQAEHRSLPGGENRKQANRKGYPSVYVVHRLDQPVEGVLVFAKTKHAAGDLSRQISDGSMRKIYRAVCCIADEGICEKLRDGNSPGQPIRLVDYLIKDGRTNTSSVVRQDYSGAKRAELFFSVKEAEGNYLHAEIELKTGRHHQIRVQMAHAGLPLYGDQKYNEKWREFLTEADRIYLSGQKSGGIPLALCAVSLTLVHPGLKKKMTFETTPQSFKCIR